VADVDRKLDSLATKLRSEFVTAIPSEPTIPAQPEVPDCDYPIQLVEVYDVSPTGLTYNFYSVGVVDMVETITRNGTEVFRHVTRGLTRDRIRIEFNLPPGRYALQLENADCRAISNEVVFTIAQSGNNGKNESSAPVLEPRPQPPSFDNPGVYRKEERGRVYEWIPSENVDVEIVDGRVRIIAPETKLSREGGNVCKRFLISDLYDNRLPEREEKALFGEGLALDPDNYEFKIVYLNADTWEQAIKNLWDLIGYNSEHRGGFYNSAEVETLKLSISDGNPIKGIASDQWRTSWFPQYQLLPGRLELPKGKAFGVTRYLENIPKDSIMSKVTHMQHTYAWVWDYPLSKAWKNLQIFDGQSIPQEPEWHINNAVINPGYILMSEYAENYGNIYGRCPECYHKAEQIYQGIYKRYQKELGITSPAQTWLVSDYFGPLYGSTIYVGADTPLSTMYQGLSDVNIARSRLHDGKWYPSAYFTDGHYNYRNVFAQGYLGNLLANLGKPVFLTRIYNLEKAGLAAPDRKKLTYLTDFQEGLRLDLLCDVGTWYRTKFEEGELLRVDGITHSFHTMLSETFYGLLFGDGVLLWESAVPMNTDPYTFDASWYGGHEDWKTRWKPNGGVANTYKPGINGPQRVKTNGQFPEKPLTSDQGAWIGAKLYERLGNVREVLWADYERDGKRVIARRGSDGTARANVCGVQNPGQNNVVQLIEKELPICLVVTSDRGRFMIFQDPFAGLTKRQLVTVEGQNFLVSGNRLHVFNLH